MATIIKDPRYPNAVSEPDRGGESNQDRIRRLALAAQNAAPLPTFAESEAAYDTEGDPGVPVTSGDAAFAAITERFRSIHPRQPGRPRRGEGVADLAQVYASADKLDARAAEIAAKLSAARSTLQDLEVNKGDVDVLDTPSLDQHLADVVKTKAMIDMLGPALAKALRDAEEARQQEGERAFDERARSLVTALVPKYAERLQLMTHHCNVLGGLGLEMSEIAQQLTGLSIQARERGQHNLALSIDELRSATVASMKAVLPAGAAPPQPPERMGESDAQWTDRIFATIERLAAAYKPPARDGQRPMKTPGFWAKQVHVTRGEDESEQSYHGRRWLIAGMKLDIQPATGEAERDYLARLEGALAKNLHLTRKGERDAAFNLRLSNWHAQNGARFTGSDPVLEAAARGRIAIDVHMTTEAIKQRARHDRHEALQLRAMDQAEGEAVNLAAKRADAPFRSAV